MVLGKQAQAPVQAPVSTQENKPKLGMRDKEERKKVKADIVREVKERNQEQEVLGGEGEKSPGKATGMREREKERKPYSYSGDNRTMRKLLAKRREEAEAELKVVQEAEKAVNGSGAREVGRGADERAKMMAPVQRQQDDDDDDRMDSTEDDGTPQPQFQPPQLNFAPIQAARETHEREPQINMDFSDIVFGAVDNASAGRVTSTGRVGRPKRERPGKVTISRAAVGAAAPAGGIGFSFEDPRRSTGPIRSSGNKFSAKFDEEEEDNGQDAGGKESGEKIKPRYEAPSGFSFAMPVCHFFFLSNVENIVLVGEILITLGVFFWVLCSLYQLRPLLRLPPLWS